MFGIYNIYIFLFQLKNDHTDLVQPEETTKGDNTEFVEFKTIATERLEVNIIIKTNYCDNLSWFSYKGLSHFTSFSPFYYVHHVSLKNILILDHILSSQLIKFVWNLK